MPHVSFHRLAERELNDAALYDERERRGLGTIFLNVVEHYIDAIVSNPNAGVKIRGLRSEAGHHLTQCDKFFVVCWKRG